MHSLSLALRDAESMVLATLSAASGGQRHKVARGQAMPRDTRTFLLDEPLLLYSVRKTVPEPTSGRLARVAALTAAGR